MGHPQKLICRICGDSYFLHPASEKPVKDLCPTCETFQLGTAAFYEEPKPSPVLGRLILALSALCMAVLVIWLIWNSIHF